MDKSVDTEIRKLLVSEDWTIVEGFTDERLAGETEAYDISGTFSNKEFRIVCSYHEPDSVIVHKVFKRNGPLFSNLRIHSKDPIKVFNAVTLSSRNLCQENYAQFVKEIHAICDKLVFNDNGVWVKVNFSD